LLVLETKGRYVGSSLCYDDREEGDLNTLFKLVESTNLNTSMKYFNEINMTMK